MAGTVGPRARGSDGSDFTHRERVAGHYQISARTKPILRKVLLIQVFCAVMCLGVGLLVKYDIPSLLCFLGYVCGIPLCYVALNRNSVNLINLYGTSCSLLGAFPMFYTLYLFLWTGAVTEYRQIRFIQAVVVILVNAGGMYFAKKLMDAWSTGLTGRTQRND